MKIINYGQILTLMFKNAALTTAGLVFVTFFASIAQNVMIVVFAAFLDGVLNFFHNVDGVSLPRIVFLIGTYISLQLFVWLEPDVLEWLNGRCLIQVRKRCSDILLDKFSKIKYCYTENTETLNLTERVMPRAEERIVECFRCYLDIAGFMVKVVGILTILAGVALGTTLLILICAIPLFMLAVKSGRAAYETTREVTVLERRAEYLSGIALGKDLVYERKLFGYGRHINDQWKEKFETARRTKLRTSMKWYVKSKLGSVFTAVVGIIAALVLIDPALKGEMTAGLYISLTGAIYGFVKDMAWDFMEKIDWLTETREYMKDFNAFLALEEVERDKGQGEESAAAEEYASFEKLEFRNVCFKYPNAESYALKNLSFTIEAGKKYCVVGVNGSGKTTIVKLVLGLYDDYEGEILLNGKELKGYGKEQLGQIFSSVFQDFSRYAISVKDNILLGGLKYHALTDDETLADLVREVGLSEEIEKLEQGMDTVLGTHFKEGQNLSGGQWQRLAVARNLAGRSEVVFFDEPTSALDPVAERNFYESLENMALKKTIIVISHRLAVARHSDMIYVISGGTVSESGSFEQLMNQQNAFFQMYESQRRWYDEEAK